MTKLCRFHLSFNHCTKMKFSIKDFFRKCKPNLQFPVDVVTFTEEILYGKFHFLCSAY